MKVYISGPMSGLPNNNKEAFLEAEDRLRVAGHEPVNPYRMLSEEKQAIAAKLGAAFRSTQVYHELIEACCQEVVRCDAVLMLPGWEDSNGANKERNVAIVYEIPIFTDIDRVAPVIKWVGDPDLQPIRGYEGDAGFDLIVSQDTHIPYREFRDVPMGIYVELPPGMWAMMTGRSSTLRRRHMLVIQSIIDNGYRGPIFAGVQNMSREAEWVRAGERIAQLIPFRLEAPTLSVVRVAELSESDRGERGFGSTGA